MIVVLTTSDSNQSRGARYADGLTAQLSTTFHDRAILIDWGADPGVASAQVTAIQDTANGVVLVAPVRNFGIAASTKLAIEQLPDLFRRRPVGIVMTAGTPRSLLAVQSLIVPLILDLQSTVYPLVVHLSGEPDECERLERFARGFGHFCECLSTTMVDGRTKLVS